MDEKMKVMMFSNYVNYAKEVQRSYIQFLLEIGVLKDRIFCIPPSLIGTLRSISADGEHFIVVRRDWSDCTEEEFHAVRDAWEVSI